MEQSKTLERLEKLGMKPAVDKVRELREVRRKMAIAYENFRYVKQEKIDEFNKELRKDTEKQDDYNITYDVLGFTKLEEYTEVPPESVLDRIEEAIKLACFDYFEIGKIESRKETKDPIIFGRITNCNDRFFVGQWDNDVTIEQILNDNEGWYPLPLETPYGKTEPSQ